MPLLSPVATLSPFIIDTFIFLREGNFSTRKSGEWMFRNIESCSAHCGQETATKEAMLTQTQDAALVFPFLFLMVVA